MEFSISIHVTLVFENSNLNKLAIAVNWKQNVNNMKLIFFLVASSDSWQRMVDRTQHQQSPTEGYFFSSCASDTTVWRYINLSVPVCRIWITILVLLGPSLDLLSQDPLAVNTLITDYIYMSRMGGKIALGKSLCTIRECTYEKIGVGLSMPKFAVSGI